MCCTSYSHSPNTCSSRMLGGKSGLSHPQKGIPLVCGLRYQLLFFHDTLPNWCHLVKSGNFRLVLLVMVFVEVTCGRQRTGLLACARGCQGTEGSLVWRHVPRTVLPSHDGQLIRGYFGLDSQGEATPQACHSVEEQLKARTSCCVVGLALSQGCGIALVQVGLVAGRARAPFLGPVEPAGDVGVGEPCRLGQAERAQGSLGVSQMEQRADR